MGAGRRTSTGRRGPEDAAVGGRGRTGRTPDMREEGIDAVARLDGIRWGAVVAGALAALLAFLLLGLLALGTGLLTEDDSAADWISAIIGLIAFFAGGYVAGRTPGDRDAPSAGRDGRRGLTNGLLAWALATVLVLVLSGLGLGQIFGPVGDPPGPLSPEQIAGAARDAALGAFFALLAWALASALGTRLGERADRHPAAPRPIPNGAREY